MSENKTWVWKEAVSCMILSLFSPIRSADQKVHKLACMFILMLSSILFHHVILPPLKHLTALYMVSRKKPSAGTSGVSWAFNRRQSWALFHTCCLCMSHPCSLKTSNRLLEKSLPINSSWDFSFICSINLSCQQIWLLSSSLPPVPSEEINCKPCNWLLFPHSGTDQKGTGIFSCWVISIKCWLSQLSKEMAVPAKSVFWEVANRAWITSPSWLVGVSISTSETSHFPEEATGKKSG